MATTVQVVPRAYYAKDPRVVAVLLNAQLVILECGTAQNLMIVQIVLMEHMDRVRLAGHVLDPFAEGDMRSVVQIVLVVQHRVMGMMIAPLAQMDTTVLEVILRAWLAMVLRVVGVYPFLAPHVR